MSLARAEQANSGSVELPPCATSFPNAFATSGGTVAFVNLHAGRGPTGDPGAHHHEDQRRGGHFPLHPLITCGNLAPPSECCAGSPNLLHRAEKSLESA